MTNREKRNYRKSTKQNKEVPTALLIARVYITDGIKYPLHLIIIIIIIIILLISRHIRSQHIKEQENR